MTCCKVNYAIYLRNALEK